MSSTERRRAILAILRAHERVRGTELASRLDVSEVTIRKDLALLEEQGYARRTHGGAVLAERYDPDLSLVSRRNANVRQKTILARVAGRMVGHGETIYLDSGSTCAAVAHEVVDKEVRVVTNSLDVLNVLADRANVSLLVVGGSYRHHAGSFIGPWAERSLESIHVDRAFLGTTGVSLDGRFSSQNSIESQVKRAAIAVARASVVIADGAKIGVTAFSVFSGPEDVNALITDADESTCRALEESGLYVIRAFDENE